MLYSEKKNIVIYVPFTSSTWDNEIKCSIRNKSFAQLNQSFVAKKNSWNLEFSFQDQELNENCMLSFFAYFPHGFVAIFFFFFNKSCRNVWPNWKWHSWSGNTIYNGKYSNFNYFLIGGNWEIVFIAGEKFCTIMTISHTYTHEHTYTQCRRYMCKHNIRTLTHSWPTV